MNTPAIFFVKLTWVEDFQPALARALEMLRRKACFEAEIREALRGWNSATAEAVVSHLREKRLINDKTTIESLIERNTGRRAVGIEKLRSVLASRGAPEELVQQALERRGEGDAAIAEALLNGRFSRKDSPAKAARFLAARGLEEDAVTAALHRYFGPLPE